MTRNRFRRQTVLLLLALLAAAAAHGQSVPVFGAEEVAIPVSSGGFYDGYSRVTVYADPKVKWQIPKATIPPWLMISPEEGSGTLPVELVVSAKQFSQYGQYSGSLKVTVPGTNTSDTMTVYANVETGAGVSPINASPANLVLRGPENLSGVFGTVKLTNANGGTGTPFQIRTSPTKWLTVTADRYTTPATLTVNAPLTGRMDQYTYHVITVIPSSGAALHIPVSVCKYAPGPSGFTLDSSPREFQWATGPTNPPSQNAAIQMTPGRLDTGPWNAFATSNGNWLRVGSMRGHGTFARAAETGEAPVWVLAEPTGLTPGRYEGTVRVEMENWSYPPQSFNVSLVVQAGLPPRITAVTHGASLAVGVIARGLVVTVWGAGCGGGTGITGRVSGNFLIRQLAGTRLLFGDIPAPLLYAGDKQINAVVPYEIPSGFTIPIELEVNGIRSDPINVQMVAAAPAIFSMNLSGSGPGAILNQNGTLNSANNPAVRGSVIVMWATGEGLVSPPASSGQVINASELRKPVLPVSVTLGDTAAQGGVPATVQYAGSAPGFVSGAMQVNVFIPPNAPTGDNVPVVLTVGSARSPNSVTVAIR